MKKLLIPIAAGLAALFAAPILAFADGGLNPIPAPASKLRPSGAIGPPPRKLFHIPDGKKKKK